MRAVPRLGITQAFSSFCLLGRSVRSAAVYPRQPDRAHKQNVSHMTDCGHELKKPRAASTRQPS